MAHAKVVSLDDDRPDEKTPTGWYKYWQKEKMAADKRLRDYHDRGNQIVGRFVDNRKDTQGDYYDTTGALVSKLNLFHTNVSTLCSMLYGSKPRIDVSREHQDPDDDVARVAAVLYTRLLELDNDTMPVHLKAALLDRLLPGMGLCRVRYDLKTSKVTTLNPETLEPEQTEQIDHEEAPIEYIHWQDFLWGWGRTWHEIPWLGFRSWLTQTEATERFGEKVATNLEYKNQIPTGAENRNETVDTDMANNVQKAEIWEFWSKQDKKVFWYSEGADKILDAVDDPLKLQCFWPMPRPMVANLTTTMFMPTADYVIAQDLYNQIDDLQTRITIITRAVKVIGVYDKSASDAVARMLKEGVENDLIPVDNWAMFAEKGGLAGVIDWFPVRDVVETLTVLRSLLGENIELLYEITGMSDILRGANTDQYTSDGTNQLKAKFGSIRVQALQDEFARFASDLEALKAEVISIHFAPPSILKQSNAQFMPEADKPLIMPAVELMQSPDIRWRVDIRPESIAMIDYAQLKSERTEFLTAMATYLQSAQAVVKGIPGSLPILLEMLKWGMAGFKGSDYLEGTMDKAIEMAKKAPAPGQDDGKKEQQAQQAEMAKIHAKMQADMQIIQAKGQQEMQKTQQSHQTKMEQQMTKNQGDMQKIMADLQADLKVIAAKLNADLHVEEAQSTFAAGEAQVEHQHAIIEEAQQHSSTMDEIDEQSLQQEDTD